jgi:hypothetical protein
MTRMNLSLSVTVLAGAALLLAGCGGSSSDSGVAHLSTGTSGSSPASGGSSSPESSASAQQKMVAYAQCMRTHGVPEFPEPSEGKLVVRSSDHNGHISGVNPRSAQFQAANKACEKLAPNGGGPPSAAEQTKMQEQALKFSQCMRSHGVPNFPDPEFSHSGRGIGIRIGGKKGGIDPNSPQFKAAQKACRSELPGPPGAKGAPVAAAPDGPGGGGSGSSQESAVAP